MYFLFMYLMDFKCILMFFYVFYILYRWRCYLSHCDSARVAVLFCVRSVGNNMALRNALLNLDKEKSRKSKPRDPERRQVRGPDGEGGRPTFHTEEFPQKWTCAENPKEFWDFHPQKTMESHANPKHFLEFWGSA